MKNDLNMVDILIDDADLGLNLWGFDLSGITLAPDKKGGEQVETDERVKYDTLKYMNNAYDSIRYDIIEGIKLNPFAKDRTKKYPSFEDGKKLLSESQKAREAFKRFTQEVDDISRPLSQETLDFFAKLPMAKGWAARCQDGFKVVVPQLAYKLCHRASKKVVDGQPLADWDQYNQLLPDFLQLACKYILCVIERRVLNGTLKEWNGRYVGRDGKERPSLCPDGGLIVMCMHAEWSELMRKYTHSNVVEWNEETDTPQPLMSDLTLQEWGGQDGLHKLFKRAGLSPTQTKVLIAWVTGIVGDQTLTRSKQEDIAKYLDVDQSTVSRNIESGLARIRTADLFNINAMWRQAFDTPHERTAKIKPKLTREEKARMKETEELMKRMREIGSTDKIYSFLKELYRILFLGDAKPVSSKKPFNEGYWTSANPPKNFEVTDPRKWTDEDWADYEAAYMTE